MRPVEYIWNQLREVVYREDSKTDLAAYLKSDEFEDAFQREYPHRSRTAELAKFFHEFRAYNKILEDTPFRCVSGEDGSLQYYHMCQKCGNILHDPHDEWYVTEHDMMCPTCNDIDVTKYPFKTIPYGSMEWINLVRFAAWNDTYSEKYPESAGYIMGSAKGLAFTVTRWMAFKWWVFVRWSKFKNMIDTIQHPVKYIKIIKKRNEWRNEMARLGNDDT